ncbi:MAG: class I SAM-dependent methyltransferase [Alphaproteobacteria bacterium]|nr:class I SAM-dependent methyltransferase [Alphaproteobacteria bacterium]
MFPDFITYLDDEKSSFEGTRAALNFQGRSIPVRNNIARFTPDMNYSVGNFSKLRERHATLQMDSLNGTNERERTILERTGWAPEFFKGKTILECGCGAGPDTEILRKFGARVMAVDIAGVDTAKDNLGEDENVNFVQASIMDLPFKKKSFDIVWCHRVIQHTPDPIATLDHILQFVKEDGAVFVQSYARTPVQMLRWKYALRPVTKRMNPEKLYNTIKAYGPFAFKLTNAIHKIPGGKYFNFFCVPFLNYRHAARFDGMTDAQMLEYGIHDTFDALSPAYDKPISARKMKALAARHLKSPVEIEEQHTITLMRTKP